MKKFGVSIILMMVLAVGVFAQNNISFPMKYTAYLVLPKDEVAPEELQSIIEESEKNMETALPELASNYAKSLKSIKSFTITEHVCYVLTGKKRPLSTILVEVIMNSGISYCYLYTYDVLKQNSTYRFRKMTNSHMMLYYMSKNNLVYSESEYSRYTVRKVIEINK